MVCLTFSLTKYSRNLKGAFTNHKHFRYIHFVQIYMQNQVVVNWKD